MLPDHRAHINRLLIVGAGAIGCRTADILAKDAAASRAHDALRLTICDYDIVDKSNLGTQPLYSEEDVGRPKATTAKKRLEERYGIKADAINGVFSGATPLDYDIIIDCTDSLEARFTINDAAKKNGIPVVFAAASDTTGFVISGACFECVMRNKVSVDGCSTSTSPTLLDAVAERQAMAVISDICGESRPKIDIFTLVGERVDTVSASVVRNEDCAACLGEYTHLRAPFALRYCQTRKGIVAVPNTPRFIDLDYLRSTHAVIADHGTSITIPVAGGTALVHRHGAIEFKDVDESHARSFAMLLGVK